MVGLVVAIGPSPRPRRMGLMIAAVASAHQMPLFTRNAGDIVGLDNVLTTISV